MFFHTLVSEFIYFRHKPIQEVTVVRYDNQCAVEIYQCLLQNIF